MEKATEMTPPDDCRHPIRHAIYFHLGTILHVVGDALGVTAKTLQSLKRVLREWAVNLDVRCYKEDK